LGRPTSWLRAVDFVDLAVYRGETLALVGESGCGKTTLARLVLRLLRASSGSVRFEQMDVLAASPDELRGFRRRVQLVFQTEGRDYWSVSIWPALVPGVAIALIVLGLNSLGDGLRDVFDPRRQRW
jgi:ABC-type oligopeptide transport system ATPase subunit